MVRKLKAVLTAEDLPQLSSRKTVVLADVAALLLISLSELPDFSRSHRVLQQSLLCLVPSLSYLHLCDFP